MVLFDYFLFIIFKKCFNFFVFGWLNIFFGVFCFLIMFLWINIMLLDIFLVKCILCVIMIIVMFLLVKFLIIFKILFISLGLSVDVGLLNNIILGFIVSVFVIVICCCWLFDNVCGCWFLICVKLIFLSNLSDFLCVLFFFNFLIVIRFFIIFFNVVLCGKRL